ACEALVRLEKELRRLNLNVQSAKTEIKTAETLFDQEIEQWLQYMDRENPDRIAKATEFFESVAAGLHLATDSQSLAKWQRPYSRALTLLRDSNDVRGIET